MSGKPEKPLGKDDKDVAEEDMTADQKLNILLSRANLKELTAMRDVLKRLSTMINVVADDIVDLKNTTDEIPGHHQHGGR